MGARLRVRTHQGTLTVVKSDRQHVRVLMAGSGPGGLGGVATVAGLFREYAGGLDGVSLRYIETYRDGPPPLRVAVFVRGAAQVLALLAARRVDVVHLHVTERASLLRKGLLAGVAHSVGVPVVMHCHGAEFADQLAAMPRRRRAALRGVFSRAHDVVVLSEAAVASVVEAGAALERVRVVPNPVELPDRVPERPAGQRVPVLFLGRLNERKGVPDLLAAVAALDPADRDRLDLRLFGDGPVCAVAARAQQLGLDGVVSVHGWLDAASRDVELARAEVFVLPSYNEGMPMALLEAMAWGLVPVVTPVGGVPALVVDGVSGLSVEPGDRPALTAALAGLLVDPVLRAILARHAREVAEGFDIQAYVRRWRSDWTALAAKL